MNFARVGGVSGFSSLLRDNTFEIEAWQTISRFIEVRGR
jgi:hypothetical protein